MTVVWNGKESLDKFCPVDHHGVWRQKGAPAYLDDAPGNSLPSRGDLPSVSTARTRMAGRKGAHANAQKRDARLYARREKVAAMRREGKTLREMSHALLVSRETIVNDIRWLGLAKGNE